MNRRVLAIALLFVVSTSNFAKVSTEERRAHLLQLRTEASHLNKKSPLDQAYLDAVRLLEQPGQCSAFFGGSEAVTVLVSLVAQLHAERINNSFIGIRMGGDFMVRVVGTNLRFRVFDDAQLNINGPFNKAKVFADEPFIPRVGSFLPNTREVRVLILMHELGHMIASKNGKWLLADDGTSPAQSRENTKIVERNCGAQIRTL
jgi:hypothetical protein